MSKLKTIMLDRSKPFATIHGERNIDDAHYKAQFQQDGLMFDTYGELILELVPPALMAKVEKKLRKLNGNLAPVVEPKPSADDDGDSEVESGHDDDDDEESGGDINIEAWLRGKANYQWFALAKEIRTRYNKNVSKTEDAVDFLINDQKIIPASEVHDKFKDYVII